MRGRCAGGALSDGAIKSTVWSDYNIAEDVGYWVKMFISMAETFPACIVISDMTIPGNPMFYVNDEFCRTTEYAKDEAQGRNCRFLQGPETEPESVEVICETLRQGIDCHVKLTNYKKNGTLFQNLLSMKPVFDADGIYRYVIGVQFEVVENEDLKARMLMLDKLLKLPMGGLQAPKPPANSPRRPVISALIRPRVLDNRLVPRDIHSRDSQRRP